MDTSRETLHESFARAFDEWLDATEASYGISYAFDVVAFVAAIEVEDAQSGESSRAVVYRFSDPSPSVKVDLLRKALLKAERET